MRTSSRCCEAAEEGASALLIAPTGGGKTLAGFLPSLVELAATGGGRGMHTLYVSPLKALATDIARNLAAPIAEMGARGALRDPHRRHAAEPPPAPAPEPARHPADDAGVAGAAAVLSGGAEDVRRPRLRRGRRAARAGDSPSAASCWRSASPGSPAWRRRRGWSACRRPSAGPTCCCAYLSPARAASAAGRGRRRRPSPTSRSSCPTPACPGPATTATYAAPALYDVIKAAGTTLVFVNTRAQAELVFQELWRA